jgi:hypothetical protein
MGLTTVKLGKNGYNPKKILLQIGEESFHDGGSGLRGDSSLRSE